MEDRVQASLENEVAETPMNKSFDAQNSRSWKSATGANENAFPVIVMGESAQESMQRSSV